jgi:hypothetical protein
MLRPLATLAFIALAALLAGPAAAAASRDPDVPLPDPPGRRRVLDHTDAKSTSKCIGKPVTPLCAVETDRACRLRSKPKLCRIAWDPQHYPHRIFSLPYPNLQDRYRVTFAVRIRDNDLAEGGSWLSRRLRSPPVRAGDILIEMHIRHCRGSIDCTRLLSSQRWLYVVRKSSEHWLLVYDGPGG